MSNYPPDKPFEPTERYMCILLAKLSENFGIRSPVDIAFFDHVVGHVNVMVSR